MNRIVSQEELDAGTPGVGWWLNKDGVAWNIVPGELSGERAEWFYYQMRPWKKLLVAPFDQEMADWLEVHDEEIFKDATEQARANLIEELRR